MTADQLRIALAKAVEHHARTLQDHGGRAGPALLDDLERIARQHAADHAGSISTPSAYASEHVIPNSSLPLQVNQADDTAPVPPQHSSARTRTRTRGGAT